MLFCIHQASIPEKYLENTLSLLHSQNKVLIEHPNASLYSQLGQYVEIEGYYLESEPCLVCNNPEVPFTNIKLSSIKVIFIYLFIYFFHEPHFLNVIRILYIFRLTLNLQPLRR